MADENHLSTAAAPTVLEVGPAVGVGDLFGATREFIADHLKADVITIEDPDTGIEVLLIREGTSIGPVPSYYYDDARDTPRFRRGTAVMTSLDSFIAHVNRFGDDDTAVFACDDRTSPKVTAVLDYHRADVTVPEYEGADDTARVVGEFRHGKHRTTFAFPLSDEWKAWTKANEAVMSMGAFAEFLEDRINDIAIAGDDVPEDVSRFINVNGGADRIADFATLFELSRGLKVYEQANVEEAVNQASGEGHIRFSVEHETRGRTGGVVKVPTMFFIAIPIFRKGAFYRIGAQLRYRKTAEGVKFWYKLYQADRSFDHAFAEAVARVSSETPAAVFYGAPEA